MNKGAFSPNNIGTPTTYKETKVRRHGTDWVPLLTKTLYADLMTNIPQTTINDVVLRQGMAVKIKGFKLRLECKHKGRFPMFVNLAVIAPKEAQGGLIPTNDFFLNDGTDPNKRSMDFRPAMEASAQHWAKINTGKYTVLLHKRWTIHSSSQTLYDPNGDRHWGGGPSDMLRYSRYLKIDRNILYNGINGTDCENPVFYAIWFGEALPPRDTTTPVDTGSWSLYIQTYFQEP